MAQNPTENQQDPHAPQQTVRAEENGGVAPAHATRERVRYAMIATHCIFALNGLLIAAWAARLPYVSDRLDINDAQLGQLLFVGAIGALIGLPLAGRIAQRIGSRATIRVGFVVMSLGWLLVAWGLLQQSFLTTMAGLVVFGAANGVWDVAQNLEGAVVERHWGKTIMPMFHASFSGGAFVGALVGSLMARMGVTLPLQIFGCLVVGAVVVALASGRFLPESFEHENTSDVTESKPSQSTQTGPVRSAWAEGRTLVIGLAVLGAAITEGSGNDWIAKAVVDGYGGSESNGALMFAVFIGAMTIFRILGSGLLDKFGRVIILRLSFGAALLGLLLFCLAPNVWVAVPGAILWGVGSALGFPVGMSAAADDPARAAARVSVVSTIGYTAFLLGPALLGFLAHAIDIRPALLTVGVFIVASLFAVKAAAPLKTPTS